jgi:hypothetical protein
MFAGPPGADTPLAVLKGLLWKRKKNRNKKQLHQFDIRFQQSISSVLNS